MCLHCIGSKCTKWGRHYCCHWCFFISSYMSSLLGQFASWRQRNHTTRLVPDLTWGFNWITFQAFWPVQRLIVLWYILSPDLQTTVEFWMALLVALHGRKPFCCHRVNTRTHSERGCTFVAVTNSSHACCQTPVFVALLLKRFCSTHVANLIPLLDICPCIARGSRDFYVQLHRHTWVMA